MLLTECRPKTLRRGYQVRKLQEGKQPDKIHETRIRERTIQETIKEWGKLGETHEESTFMAQCGRWRKMEEKLRNQIMNKAQRKKKIPFFS